MSDPDFDVYPLSPAQVAELFANHQGFTADDGIRCRADGNAWPCTEARARLTLYQALAEVGALRDVLALIGRLAENGADTEATRLGHVQRALRLAESSGLVTEYLNRVRTEGAERVRGVFELRRPGRIVSESHDHVVFEVQKERIVDMQLWALIHYDLDEEVRRIRRGEESLCR